MGIQCKEDRDAYLAERKRIRHAEITSKLKTLGIIMSIATIAILVGWYSSNADNKRMKEQYMKGYEAGCVRALDTVKSMLSSANAKEDRITILRVAVKDTQTFFISPKRVWDARIVKR